MPPRAILRHALVCAVFALPATPMPAQGSPTATAPAANRILGAVTAVSGTSVTVRQETAASGTVTVPLTPQTRLLRTAPGETTLKLSLIHI